MLLYNGWNTAEYFWIDQDESSLYGMTECDYRSCWHMVQCISVLSWICPGAIIKILWFLSYIYTSTLATLQYRQPLLSIFYSILYGVLYIFRFIFTTIVLSVRAYSSFLRMNTIVIEKLTFTHTLFSVVFLCGSLFLQYSKAQHNMVRH